MPKGNSTTRTEDERDDRACGVPSDSVCIHNRLIVWQEFNLVSIYEARRSITMAVSMKRLSWITVNFYPSMLSFIVQADSVNQFVFLPLMFVSVCS